MSAMGAVPPDVWPLPLRIGGSSSACLLAEAVMQRADVTFLCLHGGTGEDGTLQHLLDLAGLRYTGSGPLGSGLAMDKDVAKRLFVDAGVPTAPWRMWPSTAGTEAIDSTLVEDQLGWPIVVKPSKQGSTVGPDRRSSGNGPRPGDRRAARHDDEVMVEAFVPGRELTVGVLGDAAHCRRRIIPKHELFDTNASTRPECRKNSSLHRFRTTSQRTSSASVCWPIAPEAFGYSR